MVCTAAACAAVAVALVVRHRMRSSGKWGRAVAIVKEFEEQCGTPIGKLRQVADAMNVEMHEGLASEGGSKLKMLITYVDNLPSGFVQSITLFLEFAFSVLISPCITGFHVFVILHDCLVNFCLVFHIISVK